MTVAVRTGGIENGVGRLIPEKLRDHGRRHALLG